MTGVITHLLTGMDHQVRCFCLKISLKTRRLIISLPLNAGGYYRSFRHIPGRNQSFRQNSSFRHAWGEFNVAMFCGASTVCYPLDFSESKVREIWDMPWPDGRGSPVSIDDFFLSENDPPRVTHGMRLLWFPSYRDRIISISLWLFFWLHHIKKYSKMICPNHERNPTLFWSLLILDMSRTPKWTGDSEASHQMGRTWRGVASSLPSGKRLEKTNWKDPPCLMSKST